MYDVHAQQKLVTPHTRDVIGKFWTDIPFFDDIRNKTIYLYSNKNIVLTYENNTY